MWANLPAGGIDEVGVPPADDDEVAVPGPERFDQSCDGCELIHESPFRQ
jgi:hypothetical protein